MNEINLITYPDKIFSDTFSILFINPRTEIKEEFQSEILKEFTGDLNVYYFEELNPENTQIDWLLGIIDRVDIVVLDIDQTGPKIKNLVSYILSKNKTYWLTNDNNPVYNHISYKRKYNLDFLKEVGGYVG